MKTLRVGDVGTRLRVTVTVDDEPLDLTTATAKSITLRRPDGTVVTRAATFETDGSDGVVYITTEAGDLTHAGRWWMQAAVTLPTWSGKSTKHAFEVEGNL